MIGRLGLLLILAAGRGSAQAPAPGADLQVFLLTMGPGEQIDERFGHNAIWIHDRASGQDMVYNYGTFDPGEGAANLLKFAGRFAMGRPRYWLGVLDMPTTLAIYTSRHRNLEQQELDLLPAQRLDLATRLALNAQIENRSYTYDYYRDNCSTRVRDILDAVLGGALRRATVGKPAEGTLRFHTLRSIANGKLLFLGIDAGLGTPVDERLDQWDEMFLPAKVQERVREIRIPGADGRDVPLVKAEGRILEFHDFAVDAAPPRWALLWWGIGLAVALVAATGRLSGGAGIGGRIVARLWLALLGVGGLALCFLWFVSHHVATEWNLNLLYLSPLALVLLFGVRAPSARGPGRGMAWAALIVLVSLAFSVVLTMAGVQQNQVLLQLTLLPTLVIAGGVVEHFIRQRAAARP